jgi:hypothetical protein
VNPNVTQEQVAAIVGDIEMWRDEPNAVAFRPSSTITFKQLNAIGELFGTDRIDLNYGRAPSNADLVVWGESAAEEGEITVYRDAVAQDRGQP